MTADTFNAQGTPEQIKKEEEGNLTEEQKNKDEAKEAKYEPENNDGFASAIERRDHSDDGNPTFFEKEVCDLAMPLFNIDDLKEILKTFELRENDKTQSINQTSATYIKMDTIFKEIVKNFIPEYYRREDVLNELRKEYNEKELTEFLYGQSAAITGGCNFTHKEHALCPICIMSAFNKEDVKARIAKMESSGG